VSRGLATCLLLGAFGCATTAAPPPRTPPLAPASAETRADAPSDRPLTRAEQNVMASLQAEAVEVRRLPFLKPVVTRVRNAASITAALSEQMEEDELSQAREIYEALGLLPAGTDIRDLMEGVLGEQVVGYYDPETDAMVIRDDVMDLLLRGGSQAQEPRAILIHELVHALQDQHFDLKALYDRDVSGDAAGALRSLVEGDATLAMVAMSAGRGADVMPVAQQIAGNVPGLEEMMVESAMPQGGMTLSQAPAIVRATLIVPYLAGLGYCSWWARQSGWDGVDARFRELPRSTEQVLHPERVRDEPLAITLPELEGLGDRVVDEGTLGELELAVYFGQGRPSGVDAAAAAGWGGDALRVYAGGSLGSAVVWLTLWDDEAEATEAAAAAQRVGRGVPGSHVRQEGRAVLILRRVPARVRAATVEALMGAARAALTAAG